MPAHLDRPPAKSNSILRHVVHLHSHELGGVLVLLLLDRHEQAQTLDGHLLLSRRFVAIALLQVSLVPWPRENQHGPNIAHLIRIDLGDPTETVLSLELAVSLDEANVSCLEVPLKTEFVMTLQKIYKEKTGRELKFFFNDL